MVSQCVATNISQASVPWASPDVSVSNEVHYKSDKIIKFDPKIRWLMYLENNEDLVRARDNWDRSHSSFCSICDICHLYNS